MGHLTHRENTGSTEAATTLQDEQQEREQVLTTVHQKFTTLRCFVAQVNVTKKSVNLGGGFFFHYSIHGENIDWILEDTHTGHRVTIFSRDTPEKLGTAMQECFEKRMETARNAAVKLEVVAEAPTPWEGTYTEAGASPFDDESGKGAS